jgi:hypothetical protein
VRQIGHQPEQVGNAIAPPLIFCGEQPVQMTPERNGLLKFALDPLAASRKGVNVASTQSDGYGRIDNFHRE